MPDDFPEDPWNPGGSSMSNGISGFGTTVEGATTGEIGELTRVGLPGQEVNDIDVSTMQSPERWREFIAGMKDAREIQMDLLYEQDQLATVLAAVGGTNENWTVTFPDGATFVCAGYIKSTGEAAPMDDKISQTIVIKLSGKPTFTPASA